MQEMSLSYEHFEIFNFKEGELKVRVPIFKKAKDLNPVTWLFLSLDPLGDLTEATYNNFKRDLVTEFMEGCNKYTPQREAINMTSLCGAMLSKDAKIRMKESDINAVMAIPRERIASKDLSKSERLKLAAFYILLTESGMAIYGNKSYAFSAVYSKYLPVIRPVAIVSARDYTGPLAKMNNAANRFAASQNYTTY